jgi:hypothetical protein
LATISFVATAIVANAWRRLAAEALKSKRGFS